MCACRGLHSRAITHLAFSDDGHRLATVGGDELHTVAVYLLLDDGKMELLAALPSHRNRVMDCVYVHELC